MMVLGVVPQWGPHVSQSGKKMYWRRGKMQMTYSLILCKMHVHNASVGGICIALKCRSAMHNAYACPFACPVGLNLRITFFMISYSHLRILRN
jgi:hypothetical protein